MTSQREELLARRRGEMAQRKDAAAAPKKKVSLEDWGRHLAFGVICARAPRGVAESKG